MPFSIYLIRGAIEVKFSLGMIKSEKTCLLLLTDFAAHWQLATPYLETWLRGQTVRIHPFSWRLDTQDGGSSTMNWLATVTGQETIDTPTGRFEALKITFSNHQTVRLDDTVTPEQPLRFFNGIETWALK